MVEDISLGYVSQRRELVDEFLCEIRVGPRVTCRVGEERAVLIRPLCDQRSGKGAGG